MSDLHETAEAFANFFGLTADMAALAAVGPGVPLQEARERCASPEAREIARVQRINEVIDQHRQRSGGRWPV